MIKEYVKKEKSHLTVLFLIRCNFSTKAAWAPSRSNTSPGFFISRLITPSQRLWLAHRCPLSFCPTLPAELKTTSEQNLRFHSNHFSSSQHFKSNLHSCSVLFRRTKLIKKPRWQILFLKWGFSGALWRGYSLTLGSSGEIKNRYHNTVLPPLRLDYKGRIFKHSTNICSSAVAHDEAVFNGCS